jgi:ubiquinone/menaquinone biosynthesis C-methylase UbiE
MLNSAEFDQYAGEYTRTVQDAIGASGESVEFFAQLKVQLMGRVLDPDKPSSILDFGCGIGNTTRALASHFRASTVDGFDVSPESTRIADGMTPDSGGQIRYVSGQGSSLPFPDDTFDAVFAACVFHHIDEGERLHWAQELKRVLRPGGRLFLFEHNPLNPLTVRVVRRIPFDAGVVLLRPWSTRSMLRTAGYEADSPWFYFFFPAALRALRRAEILLRHVPLGAQYLAVARKPAEQSELMSAKSSRSVRALS